ncbi:MAG: hypothetical protein QM610_12640 [Chitinophagaceae bacterium]
MIFIGKDDDGNVVEDYEKRIDDIPNKIRNAMGVTVEVDLHQDKQRRKLLFCFL